MRLYAESHYVATQKYLQLFACKSFLSITSRRCVLECLDVRRPLVNIRAEDPSVVRQQAIHLALYIGGLPV